MTDKERIADLERRLKKAEDFIRALRHQDVVMRLARLENVKGSGSKMVADMRTPQSSVEE